jgi:hypothetical protein
MSKNYTNEKIFSVRSPTLKAASDSFHLAIVLLEPQVWSSGVITVKWPRAAGVSQAGAAADAWGIPERPG